MADQSATKPARPRGRPSRLTQKVKETLLTALRSGATREACALYAGIGERTLYKWMQRGEERPGSDYGHFLQEMREAEAAAELLLAGRITQASALDWRAAAWILERRHPKDYGRRDALALGGDGDAPIEFVLDLGTPGGAAAAATAAGGNGKAAVPRLAERVKGSPHGNGNGRAASK